MISGFQLFSTSQNSNFKLFWKKKNPIFVFPCCSTREDLPIDVSITNVGLILTKLWWFLFSGYGQIDRQTGFWNPHMETCRHTKNFIHTYIKLLGLAFATAPLSLRRRLFTSFIITYHLFIISYLLEFLIFSDSSCIVLFFAVYNFKCSHIFSFHNNFTYSFFTLSPYTLSLVLLTLFTLQCSTRYLSSLIFL